jgi:hypothetical protein
MIDRSQAVLGNQNGLATERQDQVSHVEPDAQRHQQTAGALYEYIFHDLSRLPNAANHVREPYSATMQSARHERRHWLGEIERIDGLSGHGSVLDREEKINIPGASRAKRLQRNRAFSFVEQMRN